MNLTSEQQKIIETDGNLSISAVAGSGKTTTILEYARSRPKDARILYLAYNKSVKTEAIRRFREMGLWNVQVETAHSLAYSYIVPGSPYVLSKEGYKPHDIVQLLNIPAGPGERHTEYVIARHILNLVTAFCNSRAAKVSELNYLETFTDVPAAGTAKMHYAQIERGARELLARMHRAQIPITHDFYLKTYQLSRPWLPHNYILFDEGQDASPAMTDVFLNQQHATRLIVGDAHQQIYSWRGAHNAMSAAGFMPYALSHSFRFGKDIARLAADVLDWKSLLQPHERVQIEGKGSSSGEGSLAVLARTNLGLLVRAIEGIEERGLKRIYFEGNLSSYTYADEGASLYDVLSLYNGQRGRIRDPLIRAMKDLEELEDYIDKTEDRPLAMMVEIVKKYGARLPAILKKLKDAHVGDDARGTAECIFSTVHRAKGLEYDTVELAPDFISEKGIERELEEGAAIDRAQVCEEVNLLYVAITRAKRKLVIPDYLKPKNCPECESIDWVKKSSDRNVVNAGSVPSLTPGQRARVFGEGAQKKKAASGTGIAEGQSSVLRSSTIKAAAKPMSAGLLRARATVDEKAKAYAPWSTETDSELLKLYEAGKSAEEIAEHFRRTRGAIQSRLKRLLMKD